MDMLDRKAAAISAALISSVLLLGMGGAGAESIVVSSTVFDKTTVIQFENSGSQNVEIIRLWLGGDDLFQSFKTEKVWRGEKSPQGLLTFTTVQPLRPGETVSFGVKTDVEKPGINWEAVDGQGAVIQTGKVLPDAKPTDSDEPEPKVQDGVLSGSTFRLVPEKINAGSTVRIVGEQFRADQEFDFYVDGAKSDSFESDGSGSFIFTSKIPDDKKAGKIEFAIRDMRDNEKTYGLTLRDVPEKTEKVAAGKLEIRGFPDTVYIGSTISLDGTGTPGGFITATITAPNGEIITTDLAQIDQDGMWSHKATIPQNALFGEYTAEITDGYGTESRTWMIESSHRIQFEPAKLKFEAGETIRFNGTAIPDETLDIVVENPRQIEVYSDVLEVGPSGIVEIEFSTQPSDPEGTYILFATQQDSTVTFLVGLGEFPQTQLIVQTDKKNYKTSDTVHLTIMGPSSSMLSLTLVKGEDTQIPLTKSEAVISLDSSGKNFLIPLSLGTGGQAAYELGLNGYKSGIYTAVVTKGNMQVQKVFTVGLSTTKDSISFQTTKTSYMPGDSILILGNSKKNTLLTLSLVDPDGKTSKSKETFTDTKGIISDTSFRIPNDAAIGQWEVIAKSGGKPSSVPITVTTQENEGIEIHIPTTKPLSGGDSVRISGSGATAGANVNIVVYIEGEVLEEQNVRSTQKGEFVFVWIIPNVMGPGTYYVNATDSHDNLATTSIKLQ